MTREETTEVLMVIQAAYPNYKPQDKTITVNTWHEMLSEYEQRLVMAALKAYIASDNKGFAPSIGQITEKIKLLSATPELNEMEAWALVSRAIRNGYYGAEEEFSKLPAAVQKAVGAPSQLRNWAMTEGDSVENVIQSNFMRTYRAVLQQQQEVSKMPAEIRNLIEPKVVRQIAEPKCAEIEQQSELKKYRAEDDPPEQLDELIKRLAGGLSGEKI